MAQLYINFSLFLGCLLLYLKIPELVHQIEKYFIVYGNVFTMKCGRQKVVFTLGNEVSIWSQQAPCFNLLGTLWFPGSDFSTTPKDRVTVDVLILRWKFDRI